MISRDNGRTTIWYASVLAGLARFKFDGKNQQAVAIEVLSSSVSTQRLRPEALK